MKNILIIDDSAVMRKTLRQILDDANYSVIEAVDGQDGLNKLQNNKIHLVLCDVNMPVMDGIEFLKKKKDLKNSKFVPVIMLTTESSKSKMDEGKEAGAKAWIIKPFDNKKLLFAISKLIIP